MFLHDAMHKRGLFHHTVSVYPSVLWCSWTLSKWINTSSEFFWCRVVTPF